MAKPAAVSERSEGLTTDTAGVFVEFQRRLRAFVSRRVRNPGDVEDILQETFLRIHRQLAKVRRTDRLAAWVFQVARSAMADHYRRQRRPGDAASVEPEPRADMRASAGVEDAGVAELAACLTPMMESLPAADRQAIELSELEGLTQREASARAGVTLSGMKSRVQRARRKLKRRLLDCCRIELDRRGGVISHEPRGGVCEPCRTAEAEGGVDGRPLAPISGDSTDVRLGMDGRG
jgi:RNA polymerase sigma-70 factor (ECF subfamily)